MLIGIAAFGLVACGTERPVPTRALTESAVAKEINQPEVINQLPADDDEPPKQQVGGSDQTRHSDNEEQLRLSLLAELDGIGHEILRLQNTRLQKETLANRVLRVNTALCERHQQIANTCLGTLPLDSVLARELDDRSPNPCEVLSPAHASTTPNTWVSLRTPASAAPLRFVLRAAGDALVSSEFAANGQRIPLAWSLTPHGQTFKPSADEIRIGNLGTGFRVAAADGSNLPPWSTDVTFSFGSGDQELLATPSLLSWSPRAGSAAISTMALPIKTQASRCTISESEIDGIIKQVHQDNPIALDTTPAADSSTTPSHKGVLTGAKTETIQNIRARMNKELLSLRSTLHKAGGTLDHLSDQGGRIRRLIEGNRLQQCEGNTKLGHIEIFIKGKHLQDTDWDRTASEIERSSEGSPERIQISMGEDLVLSNANEVKNPLFQAEGYLRSDQHTDKSPLDISHIRITKGGTGYSALLNCWSIIGWTRWGAGKKCEYQNRETHRYVLEEILVRVGGADFFKRSAINHVFEGVRQTWFQERLGDSPEYVQFMTTNSCE
jgi:hypothetical protein